MLPKDPMILLSVINTKLRDEYADLDALCDALDEDREDILLVQVRILISMCHIRLGAMRKLRSLEHKALLTRRYLNTLDLSRPTSEENSLLPKMQRSLKTEPS